MNTINSFWYEGETSVAFYYFSAFEIWANKRVVFGGSNLIRGELLNLCFTGFNI